MTKWYAEFEGNESWLPNNQLCTVYKMYLSDYEKLGKPTNIRVTVSVING